MIFYDIVDLYRSTKGDKKELLQSLVESFIKITISNMFKKDYYNNKYSLSHLVCHLFQIAAGRCVHLYRISEDNSSA